MRTESVLFSQHASDAASDRAPATIENETVSDAKENQGKHTHFHGIPRKISHVAGVFIYFFQTLHTHYITTHTHTPVYGDSTTTSHLYYYIHSRTG